MKSRIFVFGLSMAGAAALTVPACGSSSPSTPGTDAGKKDSSPPADAGKEATCAYTFEAAAPMFMTSAECTSCVETNCTALAQACACEEECIKTVQCQVACVGDGGMAEGCVLTCVNKYP